MAEYLYDMYDEAEDYDTSYDDFHERVLRNYEVAGWKDVYQNCVFPSFLQISNYIFPFIMANMFLCVASKIQARYLPSHPSITHFLSLSCGLFLLYNTIEGGHLYLILLLVSVYLLLKTMLIEQTRIRFDFIVSFYSIFFLIICELYEKDPKVWHHIRGVLMIAVMKSISLVFDTKNDHSLTNQLSILSFLGYVCCPANCIFGPWTSFGEYLSVLTKAKSTFKMNINYFVQLVLNLMISILCLLVSNCADAILVPDNSWKWITAYGAALSFRTSHYFVSFLSQATMVSSGFTSNAALTSKSATLKDTNYFGYTVVRPWNIEFPRSLVHVVVAWNVPMHCFLKQYIFRALKPQGTFIAVFLTYVISSLLHGLNFQLWATLLTIGVWSYVEYNIRKKLAIIFSACVMVTKCSVPCAKHKLKRSGGMPILINSTFFMLCFINLVYLGAIFDASSHLHTEGFSLKHTLDKWNNLDYASHWLLLLAFLFHWLI